MKKHPKIKSMAKEEPQKENAQSPEGEPDANQTHLEYTKKQQVLLVDRDSYLRALEVDIDDYLGRIERYDRFFDVLLLLVDDLITACKFTGMDTSHAESVYEILIAFMDRVRKDRRTFTKAIKDRIPCAAKEGKNT